ncbi:hypothetical protein BKA70DRAFT_1222944 [Coprinopsis sp. MPI-PUGE-AT-0042]|nr:hypothetical protein BKA70DRAFT_1222944 [Coprinopsis sp. MPI-PUGE-AT-0042]
MTEYDYSPQALVEHQKKLRVAGSWAQEVSKHDLVNPFAPRSDLGDSNFYNASRSKSRSLSTHRKAKSLSNKPSPLSDTRSISDYGGPDRPPTPPRNDPSGYGPGAYGHHPFVPQQGGTWQTGGGYVSPALSPLSPQQSPPSTVINNLTGQPLIPVWNPQKQAWEYHEQRTQGSSSGHRSSRKSRKSKRGGSLPPGLSLGHMLPGVGYAYQGGSPPPMSSPGLYPYSASQPAMSGLYLPSGHTSPASVQYALPHSAPIPQTSLQAQQQQAAQARFQQQQLQQQHARGTPPMLPVMTGVSIPMMHLNGYSQQHPMMSPPLTAATTSYTGYPSTKTGYVLPSNTSMMSGSTTQPWATVVVESKRKEKESGSSLFGRLTSGGRKKKR